MNGLPQHAYLMSEPHLSGYRVIIGYETLADAQAAQLALSKPPAREDAQPVGWLRAVDEEMVCAHLGVADAEDSFETAKKKLASLIQWNIAVATDPSVGGYTAPSSLAGGEDSAFKVATDLHAAYEALIYGLPKYLEAENLTDEENMIREAWITLDVTAHRLVALATREEAPAGDRETLRVMLDNLVIAQSLSKELRQRATDEARSYLSALRVQPQASANDQLTADEAWSDLLDKDDRTSPEDQPGMCLITAGELADYMARARPQPVALPLEDAPRDGTMLRLRVRYEAANQDEAWTPLEDSEESWTIGFNNFDNTGDDRWQFVGWDWSQDHLLEATGGAVIGWLPFHTHPAPDALRDVIEALEGAKQISARLDGHDAGMMADEIEAIDQALAALQAEQKGGA